MTITISPEAIWFTLGCLLGMAPLLGLVLWAVWKQFRTGRIENQ